MLSEDGIVTVAHALSALPHLRYLNVMGNSIRSKGLEVFLETCPSMSELETLDIGHNGIDDDGVEMFFQNKEKLN